MPRGLYEGKDSFELFLTGTSESEEISFETRFLFKICNSESS